MRMKLASAARRMPRLVHCRPGEEYDTHKSQVIDWLVQQPGVRQTVLDLARESKAIRFDPETHTWEGTGSES